jgi:hypothetical protein
MTESTNARRGGRAARNALRAAPLTDDIKQSAQVCQQAVTSH